MLLLPSVALRVACLHRNVPVPAGKRGAFLHWASWISGLCQDLFIAYQQLFLFSIFPGNWSWIGATLAALLQLDILFDAFLYKGARIRMEAPFFAFINDVRCFWDSAKAKGLGFFFPLAVVLFFAIVIGFFFLARDIDFVYSLGPFYIALGAAIIGLAGLFALPKMVSYAIDNVVLTQEVWIVKKLLVKWTRKSRLVKAKEVSKNFVPQGEKCSAISPSYPLLKFTHGFTGERRFAIDLPEGEKPNIVFFFLESMRAKDVNETITPNLHRLSQEGVYFPNFYANSVKTSRAVTSSLFGVPSDVTSSEVSNRTGRPFISIADILAEDGYHTAYLHNGDLGFENQRGFMQHYGFEELVGKDEIKAAFPDAPMTSWGLPDEYLVSYAKEWVTRQKDPFFATLFTITNHHPWIVPENFTPPPLPDNLDPRHARYLSTMAYSDQALGAFVDHLRETGLAKKTLLFVLGDHGQPMGEHHDNFVEQRYLYEENIRVPLLILADGYLKEPTRIETPGSQVDLLSTVMDLANVKGLNHAIGASLARATERPVFFHNPYMYRFYGMRRGDHKLIHLRGARQVELYNLAQDPDERQNIAKEHPELVAEGLREIHHYNLLFQSIYENKLFS